MMTSWLVTIPFALLFASFAFAPSATAAENDAFSSLDTDGSGGLSLEEVQTARPEMSAFDFLAYDADGTGELSAEEFDAWSGAEARSKFNE